MNDSQSIVEILIKFGLLDAQNADTALQKLQELDQQQCAETDTIKENAEATKGLNKEMEFLPDSLKNVAEGHKEAGHMAGSSRLEHMALHHAFRELDKICPGLGMSLNMMARGMHSVEGASRGAAAGAGEATAAFETMMATILPLLAVMLTIQAITTYWDLYKKSVEEAAKAQEEAMKRIQESTKGALKAVEELNEAMHPKAHTTAEKDEEDLKKKIEGINEQHDRQKELNKANEERELGTAQTPEQKAAIKSKYAAENASLDDFTKGQIAAAQAAMAETIKGQIAAIDSTVAAKTKAESEQFRENAEKLSELQKQKEILGPTHDTSAIDKKIADLEEQQRKILSGLKGEIDGIKNKAGDLGKTGEKVAGDAADAAHKLGFGRETTHEVGSVEHYGQREQAVMGYQGGQMTETFGQLLAATGKTHAQTEAILKQIISGHADFGATIKQLQSQVAYLQQHHGT